MKYVFLALLFLNSSSVISSGLYQYEKVPGEDRMVPTKKLDNKKNQKVKNRFHASLVITNDKSVFERWLKPSDGFSLNETHILKKGETFFPLLIFSNPALDKNGNSNISYIIRIENPDGSIYADEMLVGWNKKVVGRQMLLTENYLSIEIEKKDMFGNYKVFVYVRDNISGTDIPLESSFEITKDKNNFNDSNLLTDEEFNHLLMHYYQNPEPSKIPMMTKFMSNKIGLFDKREVLYPFFQEVYAESPSIILKSFESCSIKACREFVLDSIWRAGKIKDLKKIKDPAKLDEGEITYINKLLKKSPSSFQDFTITKVEDIDRNWAAYFASGKEKYVRNIAQKLIKQSSSRDELMLFTSVGWSLSSNCQQLPEVYNIVKNIIREKETDNEIALKLQSLIKNIKHPHSK